jgi:hypothetical protein
MLQRIVKVGSVILLLYYDNVTLQKTVGSSIFLQSKRLDG